MGRWNFLFAAVALFAGCVIGPHGPSNARLNCTASCESQHDQCLLAALNPQSVDYCDRNFAGCLRGCPPQ